MPNEDTKFKYQVSYYNNNMVSFCPASALHDFAVNFNVFMPKSITKSNRDQAILDALSDLDPGILKGNARSCSPVELKLIQPLPVLRCRGASSQRRRRMGARRMDLQMEP